MTMCSSFPHLCSVHVAKISSGKSGSAKIEPVTFANLECRNSGEIQAFPHRILRALPRPRILKSHSWFRSTL